MRLFPVAKTSEIPPGGRKIVNIEGKSIGVFNIQGVFYALRNVCPHQFAPLCLGKITGHCEESPVGEFHWIRDGEILRCPWHAWEFDIKTGKSIFNPHRVKTKSYEVEVRSLPGPAESSVENYLVLVQEEQIFIHFK